MARGQSRLLLKAAAYFVTGHGLETFIGAGSLVPRHWHGRRLRPHPSSTLLSPALFYWDTRMFVQLRRSSKSAPRFPVLCFRATVPSLCSSRCSIPPPNNFLLLFHFYICILYLSCPLFTICICVCVCICAAAGIVFHHHQLTFTVSL